MKRQGGNLGPRFPTKACPGLVPRQAFSVEDVATTPCDDGVGVTRHARESGHPVSRFVAVGADATDVGAYWIARLRGQ
jgi:hypothetical protein